VLLKLQYPSIAGIGRRLSNGVKDPLVSDGLRHGKRFISNFITDVK
jgi:hypothetical protein